MASPTGRRLHRDGFPHHEIVQRLAGFVGDKFDHGSIIDETEDGRCVRNQIEWIDQIIQSSNDPQQCVVRDIIILAAMIGAHQAQHGLQIRPTFFERLPRHCCCLFRCVVKKREQSFRIIETRFCIDQSPHECFAAKRRFTVGNSSLRVSRRRPDLWFCARLRFRFFHLANQNTSPRG